MSYLSMLQELRQQGSPFEQFVASAGGAAKAVGAALKEERERNRLEAQQRAKALMQQGESAFRSGQFEAAARVVPQLQGALQQGYDIKPVVAPPVGSPIYGPMQAPTVQPLSPMRVDMPQLGLQPRAPRIPGGVDFERVQPVVGLPPRPSGGIPRQEIGRSFESPQTRANIRAGLMMQPTPPIRVGDALYFPDTGEIKQIPQEQTQRMGWVTGEGGVRTFQPLQPGTISLPAPRAPRAAGGGGGVRGGSGRAPRLTEVFDPETNEFVVVPMVPGLRKPLAPARDVMVTPSGEVIAIAQPPVVQPAGKPYKKPKPAGKRAVAKPLSPADLRNISDQALAALLRETPRANGDTRILTRLIATQPELAKRYNDLETQIRRSIMAERQQASEEQNTGVRPIQVEPLPDLAPANETKMQRIIRLMEEDKKARSGQRQGGAGR